MPTLPDGTRLPYPGEPGYQSSRQTQTVTRRQTQRQTQNGTPDLNQVFGQMTPPAWTPPAAPANANDLGGAINALTQGLVGNASNRAFSHPLFRTGNLLPLTPNPQEQFGQFLQRYLDQLRASLPGRGIGSVVGNRPASARPATPSPAAPPTLNPLAPPPAVPATGAGVAQPVVSPQAIQALGRIMMGLNQAGAGPPVPRGR